MTVISSGVSPAARAAGMNVNAKAMIARMFLIFMISLVFTKLGLFGGYDNNSFPYISANGRFFVTGTPLINSI